MPYRRRDRGLRSGSPAELPLNFANTFSQSSLFDLNSVAAGASCDRRIDVSPTNTSRRGRFSTAAQTPSARRRPHLFKTGDACPAIRRAVVPTAGTTEHAYIIPRMVDFRTLKIPPGQFFQTFPRRVKLGNIRTITIPRPAAVRHGLRAKPHSRSIRRPTLSSSAEARFASLLVSKIVPAAALLAGVVSNVRLRIPTRPQTVAHGVPFKRFQAGAPVPSRRQHRRRSCEKN